MRFFLILLSVASPATAPRGDALLRDTVLAAHNAARARVGVPALRWDEALAADARVGAEQLARGDAMAHARRTGRAADQGENLWSGTSGSWHYDEMVGDWVDEGRNFVNLPPTRSSRTGRWGDVSHYVQIVWRKTTAVGCAVAAGRRDEYLVCRYSPAGNVVGQPVY